MPGESGNVHTPALNLEALDPGNQICDPKLMVGFLEWIPRFGGLNVSQISKEN